MRPRTSVLLAVAVGLAVLALAGAPIVSVASPAPSGGHPAGSLVPSAASSTVNYVSIYSTYKGQANYLAVPNNSTGAIVYAEWVVTVVASPAANYTLYEGDLQLVSGTVLGERTFTVNVTGSPVTAEVILGGAVYHYTGEVVLTVGVSTYYSSPPPQLIYSAEQLVLANVSVIVAAILAVAIGMLVSYRTVVARAKREVRAE